jgi:hypothetical protein
MHVFNFPNADKYTFQLSQNGQTVHAPLSWYNQKRTVACVWLKPPAPHQRHLAIQFGISRLPANMAPASKRKQHAEADASETSAPPAKKKKDQNNADDVQFIGGALASAKGTTVKHEEDTPAAQGMQAGGPAIGGNPAAASGQPQPSLFMQDGGPVLHPCPIGSNPAPASGQPQPSLILVRPKPQAPKSEWLRYFDDIAGYVLQDLPKELKNCGIGIGAYGGLHHVPPTDIKTNVGPAIGGANLTTFKEKWNVERCLQSMKTTGKYEAAGSLWWFKLVGGRVEYKGQMIFEADANQASVDAAWGLWDVTSFVASDLVEHQRRFNFPGILPTACAGLPEAEQTLKIEGHGDTPTFKNLPLVAGRQVILALLENIAACMQSTKPADKERLRKLFEARQTPFQKNTCFMCWPILPYFSPIQA